MKKNGDGIRVDLSAHSGNKVSPIGDPAAAAPLMRNKKESVKGEIKSKGLSRMKELLKWAASPKSEKPAKFITFQAEHFGNQNEGGGDGGSGGGDGDDDGGSIESPKLSLRWDTESYCKISSALVLASEPSSSDDDGGGGGGSGTNSSQPRISASRRANWITTDSDFVVLELLRE